MPASLAIHRFSARTPARAQPVAARLALQALGADLEDALPRGLPPQALLWLRRLKLQAPEAALLRPAPAAWRQDWIASGRERLDAALAQAARPALGPVPEDAEAVLFADEAEMLACLALAARAGQLDRWWWRGLLGRTWPHWPAAWAARPQAQAAAQRLLQRAGQGREAAFDAGPAEGVTDLAGAAAVSAEAMPLPGCAAGVTNEVLAEPAPRELPMVAVDGQAAVQARPVVVAREAGISRTVDLAAVAALAAAAIEAKPSTGDSRVEAVEWVLPLPGVRAKPQAGKPGVADTPRPPAPRAAPINARPPSPLEASPTPQATPSVQVAGVMPVDQRRAAVQPVRWAASPRIATPPETLPASQRLESVATAPVALTPGALEPQRQPEAFKGTAAAVPREHAEPMATHTAWPWPQALLSQRAPLLFIVNLLLEDGLYPDFTRPRDPGLPVPLWALLAGLARVWRLPDDALDAALAERAGDWAEPEWLPAAPGAPAGPWSLWLPAYARSLRRRLCRRLGLRAAQWPAALTLAHPARLWLSEAEWVAEFDLAGHDVAWRLAGLDRDPGWLPSVDCSLRFEFR